MKSFSCSARARRRTFRFARELQGWSARRDLQVHITVDHAVGKWRGNVGVVTRLIHHALFEPSNAIAMMCGPEVMMRFTALELQKPCGAAGAHLRFTRAQYEMRDRFLRSLPIRADVHLQGRSGFSLRPGETAAQRSRIVR